MFDMLSLLTGAMPSGALMSGAVAPSLTGPANVPGVVTPKITPTPGVPGLAPTTSPADLVVQPKADLINFDPSGLKPAPQGFFGKLNTALSDPKTLNAVMIAADQLASAISPKAPFVGMPTMMAKNAIANRAYAQATGKPQPEGLDQYFVDQKELHDINQAGMEQQRIALENRRTKVAEDLAGLDFSKFDYEKIISSPEYQGNVAYIKTLRGAEAEQVALETRAKAFDKTPLPPAYASTGLKSMGDLIRSGPEGRAMADTIINADAAMQRTKFQADVSWKIAQMEADGRKEVAMSMAKGATGIIAAYDAIAKLQSARMYGGDAGQIDQQITGLQSLIGNLARESGIEMPAAPVAPKVQTEAEAEAEAGKGKAPTQFNWNWLGGGTAPPTLPSSSLIPEKDNLLSSLLDNAKGNISNWNDWMQQNYPRPKRIF